MRSVTVEFTVTASLTERGEMACVWHCSECTVDLPAKAVRAHLILHSHDEIGVPS